MTIEIKSWMTGGVLFSLETESLKLCVEAAVKSRADLTGANLTGAYLRGAYLTDANLTGAKNLRLPTGETWEEYLRETVPALLTAGGKSLESFAEHWQCHTWDNCPMAHAFGAGGIEQVPILLRPRAEQFIQFYDAGQIPWPLPTAENADQSDPVAG